MDGCARGSKTRSNYRLLYLESLEDRFLLSTLVAPPIDHVSTSPSPMPLASGTADKQAVVSVPANAPAPSLHLTLPTVSLTSPPASTPVISFGADPYRHDNDSPAAEYAEHDEKLALQGLVMPYCAGTLSQNPNPNAECNCHSSPTPLAQTSGGAALATLPATSGEAATGFGADRANPAALLAYSASTSASEFTAPRADHEQQDSAGVLVAVPEAQSATTDPAQAPKVLPMLLGPLAGLAPFDLEGLEKGVDAFFTHLTELANDWEVPQLAARSAPWLVAVTAVALEVARRRKKTSADTLNLDAMGLPGWPGSFSGEAT